MKIEVNTIMNPAVLFGTPFIIAYWHKTMQLENQYLSIEALTINEGKILLCD